MERASLRPVPRRPEGPVDPAAAIAHVAQALPDADESARSALALVEIAGLTRERVAAERDLDDARVAEALARGRKALRRSLYPLPGSGWCERAERMISDRIDGLLEPPGPARLSAHLSNCPRCVEHDLRLAQGTDALIAGFIEAHAAQSAVSSPPSAARPVIRAARSELQVLPFGAPVAPAPAKLRAEPVAETPPEPAAPTEPVVPPPPEPVAAPEPLSVAETPPAERSARPSLAWGTLHALAILLAVLTVIVTALGVAGVDPF